MMGRVEWVAEFYRKQYEWADWRSRWADFDPARSDPRVAAVTRLAGAGPMRILELGAGTGNTAAALAHAGHDVVAIELQPMLSRHIADLAKEVSGGSLRAIPGDFYEVDPGGGFDVVAYLHGSGIGTDGDQRRLLQRVGGWLVPGGCALVDVFVPWYWAKAAGHEEEFPEGSGIRYRDGFDPDGSRMVEQMWRDDHEDDVVTQTLRCYSPADLRSLLEGTVIVLDAVEPYDDESYAATAPLAEAMLYLAKLVPG